MCWPLSGVCSGSVVATDPSTLSTSGYSPSPCDPTIPSPSSSSSSGSPSSMAKRGGAPLSGFSSVSMKPAPPSSGKLQEKLRISQTYFKAGSWEVSRGRLNQKGGIAAYYLQTMFEYRFWRKIGSFLRGVTSKHIEKNHPLRTWTLRFSRLGRLSQPASENPRE